jgi:hypothetical protein
MTNDRAAPHHVQFLQLGTCVAIHFGSVDIAAIVSDGAGSTMTTALKPGR